MLIFTEHMNRIAYLTDEALKHTQDEKFDAAREDLIKISINTNEAIQQIDDLIVMQHQGPELLQQK